MRVLVTGGAGYIGSHAVLALGEQGHGVLVFDNLSTGHRESVLHGDLVAGDLADQALVTRTLREFRPDAVMHFAAFIRVDESMHEPAKYFANNTANTLNLLRAMTEAGVTRFVFSSTAATYGTPEVPLITEDTPQQPINPYGMSKLLVERALRQMAELGAMRYVALRYFNVAGADPQGRIGQKYPEATHLITRALKTAKGEFPALSVFGTDYPTPDGTCVRDYIHVLDIAEAHVRALEWLEKEGRSDVFNLGYGRGYSVREVVERAKQVTGINFPVVETGRREGDPAALVASSSKARRVLGWTPRHDNLEFIIKTAWDWEKKLPPA